MTKNYDKETRKWNIFSNRITCQVLIVHYRSSTSVDSVSGENSLKLLIQLEYISHFMIGHNYAYAHSLYGQKFRSLYSVYEGTNILGMVHTALDSSYPSCFGFCLEYVISQNILQGCLVYNLNLVVMVTDR